jgi:hypothetical protein
VDVAPEERLLLAGQARLRLQRRDTAMGDTVILAENASNDRKITVYIPKE